LVFEFRENRGGGVEKGIVFPPVNRSADASVPSFFSRLFFSLLSPSTHVLLVAAELCAEAEEIWSGSGRLSVGFRLHLEEEVRRRAGAVSSLFLERGKK